MLPVSLRTALLGTSMVVNPWIRTLDSLAFRYKYFGGFRLIQDSLQDNRNTSTSTLRLAVTSLGGASFLGGGGGGGSGLTLGGGGTTLNLILGLLFSASLVALLSLL